MANPIVQVRLHPDLAERLRQEADSQGHITRSAVISIALTEYFKRKDAEKLKKGGTP